MKNIIKVSSVFTVLAMAACAAYSLAQDSKAVLNAKQLGIQDLDLDLGLDEDLVVAEEPVKTAAAEVTDAATAPVVDVPEIPVIEPLEIGVVPDVEETAEDMPEVVAEVVAGAEEETGGAATFVDEVGAAVDELVVDPTVDTAMEAPAAVEEIVIEPVAEAPVAPEVVEELVVQPVEEVVEDAPAAVEELVVEPAVEVPVGPAEEAVEVPVVPSEEAVEKPAVTDIVVEIEDILSNTAEPEEAAVIEAVEVPAEAPAADAPAVEPPVIEVPAVEVPAVEVPAVEVPAVEVPASASAVVLDPAVAKRVSELEVLEEGRRKLFDQHGRESIQQGDAAIAVANWSKAIERYNDALKFLLPKEVATRKLAENGLAEAYYRLALEQRVARNYEEAEKSARQARHFGHPKAEELLLQIQADRTDPPPPEVLPVEKRYDQPKYKEAQAKISSSMKVAKEYYATGELKDARREVEFILKDYPWHKDAVDLLRKISIAEHRYANNERITTRESMVKDAPPPPTTQEQLIREKMQKIVIPDLDFRDANITDIVGFLGDASRENDDPDVPPDERGINFILNLGEDALPVAAPAADPWGIPPPATTGGTGGTPLITIKARFVKLSDAMDMIMEMAGLKYRVRGNMVLIMPKNRADDTLIHKMYNVLPSIEDRVPSLQPTGGGLGGFGNFGGNLGAGVAGPEETKDWKKLFGDLGVPWPDKSSIQYMPSLTKLVVVNTAENLAILESVLSILNVTPKQVEIEVRFVEVMQSDLDSLGLEWMVNDDWEIAEMKKDAALPPASRRRLVMKGGNVTRGFNYLSGNTAMGINEGEAVLDNIATFSSVLTNPELSIVLHMLSSKQNTDLLSAPKVVTKAGSPATIKVVTEYIYPTEYDVEMLETSNDTGTTTTYSGAVVEPQNFNMREVGVILEVTPTVTDDGSMIDLALAPAVVSEPIWKNYGSTYPSLTGEVTLPMEQPFFPVRSVATTVQIYNGATIVMGGMITEERFTNEDKIPFLGDLPLFGNLFRYKYDYSEKRNLLLFVTAKLVDPGGRETKDVQQTDQKVAEMLLGERK